MKDMYGRRKGRAGLWIDCIEYGCLLVHHLYLALRDDRLTTSEIEREIRRLDAAHSAALVTFAGRKP